MSSFFYSIKFYDTSYLSNATYKLLYYTTRTKTTESKYLWQLCSLNIEKKFTYKRKDKKEVQVYLKLDVIDFYKKQSNCLPCGKFALPFHV